MKGFFSLILLMTLLFVGYLVVRDLGVLSGVEDGEVVINPMQQAQDTADLVNRTRDNLKKSLDDLDR